MIEAAVLAALRVSVGNSDAIEMLALIELRLAQTSSSESRHELGDLVERWSNTLVDIDSASVIGLKQQLQSSFNSWMQNAASIRRSGWIAKH